MVAIEALSLGTPVLVSDKSGAGELLTERTKPSEAHHFVVPTPDDLDAAAANWAKAIEFVLRDRSAAFRRTAELRSRLAEGWSWASEAERLICAIEQARGPRDRAAQIGQ
jgi:glycosyltransferase involved in cell wall biosynthesis